jgi:hypothetical protein
MKKSNTILRALVKNREQNILKLLAWKMEDIVEWKERYYQAYQDTKSEVIYEKYSQMSEAHTIKRGNEEEVWDSLT